MFALNIAILATTLGPDAVAASSYTVWASVIYSRTGERTPEVLGDIPTTLTSLGAQQVYSSGTFFRDRYISSSSNDSLNSAPLQGLSANTLEGYETYVGTLDEQWTIASAQAFLQGLYPPFTLNASTADLLDPTSVLANKTYIEYPLGGYQYPQIHAAGALDPDFPYLGGSLDCPGFDAAAIEYMSTPEFQATQADSASLYEFIGATLLYDVLVDPDDWSYYNAYSIYDYVNYQNAHNESVAVLLDTASNSSDFSYMDALRWYADQSQYATLGDLTKQNNYTETAASSGTSSDQPLPGDITGSISTIAGNLLAAKMLAQLQVALETQGAYYKLSILFGDFEPLLSFFALAKLPDIDSNFKGLPDFGSVMVFEVYSYTNDSLEISFPSTDDLWVRCYFRNGTGIVDEDTDGDASGDLLQSYPLFGRGPSETDMTWNDFQNEMYGILMSDIGTWCTQCGATNIFCAAWNTSVGYTSSSDAQSSSSSQRAGLSPAVAGTIGAVVTLAIAALLFAAAMVIGGLRFHRVKSHKSEMGGFKGSQKLASDRDFTIPKGGAVVGASVERDPGSPVSPIGHERVGSWELKQAESGKQDGRRRSEDSEFRIDPTRQPVKAEERV